MPSSKRVVVPSSFPSLSSPLLYSTTITTSTSSSPCSSRSLALRSSTLLLPPMARRPVLLLLMASFALLLWAKFTQAGSFESPELTSAELLSGKRTLSYRSYQPWSYMKRAAPIIRFGKRSAWDDPTMENGEAITDEMLIDSLVDKRVPVNSPLIRFGRRPADGAPLIRFGKRASSLMGAPLIRFGRSTMASSMD